MIACSCYLDLFLKKFVPCIANSLELLCDENTPPLGFSGLLLNLELESQKPKMKEPVFYSLNPFYKTFSYGYGFPHNGHGTCPKIFGLLHLL